MKKINLKTQLTAFGKPCNDHIGKPILINEVIANALVQGRSSQPAKMMSIATRLYEKGEVELDQPDVDFLLQAITSSQQITDLVIATTEQMIKEQTAEKK